jgi:hypothetical protein
MHTHDHRTGTIGSACTREGYGISGRATKHVESYEPSVRTSRRPSPPTGGSTRPTKTGRHRVPRGRHTRRAGAQRPRRGHQGDAGHRERDAPRQDRQPSLGIRRSACVPAIVPQALESRAARTHEPARAVSEAHSGTCRADRTPQPSFRNASSFSYCDCSIAGESVNSLPQTFAATTWGRSRWPGPTAPATPTPRKLAGPPRTKRLPSTSTIRCS